MSGSAQMPWEEAPGWARALFLEMAEIRRAVSARKDLAPLPSPVCTMDDVRAWLGGVSASTANRWVRRWAPNARCGAGEFTTAALRSGRERQAKHFAG